MGSIRARKTGGNWPDRRGLRCIPGCTWSVPPPPAPPLPLRVALSPHSPVMQKYCQVHFFVIWIIKSLKIYKDNTTFQPSQPASYLPPPLLFQLTTLSVLPSLPPLLLPPFYSIPAPFSLLLVLFIISINITPISPFSSSIPPYPSCLYPPCWL